MPISNLSRFSRFGLLAAVLALAAALLPDVVAAASSAPTAAVDTLAAGAYQPLTPTRILDSRSGLGAAKRAVGGGATLRLTVGGRGGVPSTGVSAVALNVTATNTAAAGYVTAFPGGSRRPLASNLNHDARSTVAASVVVGLGADASVALFNGSAGVTDLVVDVQGWYRAGPDVAAGGFIPVPPTRVLDTRVGTGGVTGPVTGARPALFSVRDSRFPDLSTAMSAVVVNVTATSTVGHGYVQAADYHGPRRAASNLNFTTGQTVANLVMVPLAGKTGDQITLTVGGGGRSQLVADVVGFVVAGSSQPFQPGATAISEGTRVLDTRIGRAAVPAFGRRHVPLAAALPAHGVGAAIVNVTVTDTSTTGFVTVYPGTGSPPTASNLNYVAGQTVANLVVVPVDADGSITLYNGAGRGADLIVDVVGYVASAATTGPDDARLAGAIPGVTDVALSWTLPTATDYSYLAISRERSDGTGGATVIATVHTPARSFDDVGLDPATRYTYRFTAYDSAGRIPEAQSPYDLGIEVETLPDSDGWGPVRSLTTNGSTTCAASADGTARCAGTSGSDGIDPNALTTVVAPATVRVPGAAGIVDVAEGVFHSCGLTVTGTVMCWGSNYYGAFGDGHVNDTAGPVEATGITNATSVGVGSGFTCAALRNGTVWCWGRNTEQQLGNGSTTDSTVPVRVRGIDNASAVTASPLGACALLADTTVKCWGSMVLGNGTTASSVPVVVTGLRDVVSLDSSFVRTCASTSDGTVWCWGLDDPRYGPLPASAVPVEIAGFTHAASVAVGVGHVCALDHDATVRCAGGNNDGQLGNGTTQSTVAPTLVTGLSAVLSLSADGDETCAVVQIGAPYCWGDGSGGATATGTINPVHTVPTRVIGLG